MNKKKKIVTVVILLFIVLAAILVGSKGSKNGLISPGLLQSNPIVTSLPASANNPPKEIKYDSSTDLKKELDTINPQVLNSDFE